MNLLATFKEYSSLFLAKKTPTFKRDLLKQIKFKNPIIGIIGAKGVGKTTLLLQHMKELNLSSDEMLYISVDHPLMSSTTILDIAKEFASYGGKVLILDEIHAQDNFAQDLKTIWDFLEIQVIFSGSSALHLDNADLSRRVLRYTLPTLSFREFIQIQTNIEFPILHLEDILTNHTKYSQDIINHIKPLKYFKDYFEYGYYPFYLEDDESSKMKLLEAINKTIEIDLLKIYNIDSKKLRNIKKILAMLCSSVPYKPNITTLASSVEVDPKTLYTYLDALQKGKIIRMIAPNARGEAIIKKPEKIYLDNPNMFKVLCNQADIGTLRESFISGSLQNSAYSITASKQGDFIIDKKYTIEVGGKNKTFKQIKDLENSYIAADDIEIGNGAKIPLYLFGFLY
jgi:predicted AAA+ superfamily ATPase